MMSADYGSLPLEVVCALIYRGHKLLVCQKASGPRAGLWEFPGGKIQSGETPFEALQRELKEELNILVQRAEESVTVHHQYPDIRIELRAWKVTGFSGEPEALEHRDLKWVGQDELSRIGLCAADGEVAVQLKKSRISAGGCL